MRLLSSLFLAALSVAACSKSSSDKSQGTAAPLPKSADGAARATAGTAETAGVGTGATGGTAQASGAPGGTGDGSAAQIAAGSAAGEVKPPHVDGEKGAPAKGDATVAAKSSWQILDQEGPHGPDDTFNLAISGPASVAPGATARFELTVTPGAAYKINVCDAGEADCTPYPVKLELSPPAGVSIAKPKLTQDDVSAMDKAHLVIAFEAVPDAAGAYAIPAKFKFAVCQAEFCKPRKLEMSFALAAK